MSQVGDLLELVLLGPSRLTSCSGGLAMRFHASHENDYRFVWASGDRMRIEGQLFNGAMLFVQDGPRWWRWHDKTGVTTNTLGNPSEEPGFNEPITLLMGHGRLAMNPGLEVVGHDEVVGRDAIVFRVPEREFAVDAEHGVTLLETYRNQRILEVSQIEFNVDVPEQCFEFEAPVGAEVHAASGLEPIELPLDEAAGRVDYPLFAPYGVVVGWPLEASLYEERGDQPERVIVGLRNAPIWISHSPRADPESFGSRFAGQGAWHHVTKGGVDLLVRENPAIVRFVRDGVHLEIWGEADNLEQLIAVAIALTPIDRPE